MRCLEPMTQEEAALIVARTISPKIHQLFPGIHLTPLLLQGLALVFNEGSGAEIGLSKVRGSWQATFQPKPRIPERVRVTSLQMITGKPIISDELCARITEILNENISEALWRLREQLV